MRRLWAIVPCVIFIASPARPQQPRKAPAGSSVPRPTYDIDSIAKELAGPTPVKAPTDPADKAARAHLPKEAEHWTFIGAFKLEDRGRARLVTLYHSANNYAHPPPLLLDAVYQDLSGAWVHKEIFGGYRVGFRQVKSVTPEAVVLEFHSGGMPWTPFRPNESRQERKKRILAAVALQAFTQCLSFEKGELVLK